MADVFAWPRRGRSFSAPLLFLLLLGGMILAALNMLAVLPAQQWFGAIVQPATDDVRQIVFHYATLPRIAVGLLAGGALALSGTLLQQILQNPLAEPSTLGISAGAYLALTASAVFAPGLLAHGRTPVALAGGFLAIIVVMALSWRRRLAPLTVILAGLVVGLYCAALADTLALVDRDTLLTLSMWSSGSLAQSDWQPARYLVAWLLPAILLSALLMRPLALLGLGDEAAQAAGVAVTTIRLLGLAIGVALAAVVVAAIGVIGFIGLLAPTLARLCGARTLRAQLISAPLLGAALLFCSDQAISLTPFTGTIPVGAMTAVAGAPALFLLTRRMTGRPAAIEEPASFPHGRTGFTVTATIALLVLALVIALFLGRDPNGWHLAVGDELGVLLPWRAPRTLASAGAGALLAVSGALLQRMTGNVMASPEVLGIGAGAMLGIIVLAFLQPEFGRFEQFTAASAGAGLVLAAIFVLGRRTGFAGETMLLAGIVLTTLLGVLATVLTTSGDPRTAALRFWMSGSTYRVDWREAAFACASVIPLLVLLVFCRRWLEILPLGEACARSLGVRTGRSRTILLAGAATAAAAATLVVGPLSFVGLIAPRIALRLGLHTVTLHACGSAVIGAAVMIFADWLGRTLLFPREIPAGLLASIVGGPFFILMLLKSR